MRAVTILGAGGKLPPPRINALVRRVKPQTGNLEIERHLCFPDSAETPTTKKKLKLKTGNSLVGPFFITGSRRRHIKKK